MLENVEYDTVIIHVSARMVLTGPTPWSAMIVSRGKPFAALVERDRRKKAMPAPSAKIRVKSPPERPGLTRRYFVKASRSICFTS